HDLHEAFGLPRPPRAPVRREGESSDDVVELALLALVLGETDARDLGVAVRHAGDVVVFDRVRLAPRDLLGHDYALAEPFVRQHRRARHVADRVASRRGRLEARIDLDEAAIVELDAGFLEADVLGIDGSAGGHQADRGLQPLIAALGLAAPGDPVLADVRLRHL